MRELYKKHRTGFLIAGMAIIFLMCAVISLDFYSYPNASSEYGWVIFLSVGEKPTTVINLIKSHFFSVDVLEILIAALSAIATWKAYFAARQSSEATEAAKEAAKLANQIAINAIDMQVIPERLEIIRLIRKTHHILNRLKGSNADVTLKDFEEISAHRYQAFSKTYVFGHEFHEKATKLYNKIESMLHGQTTPYDLGPSCMPPSMQIKPINETTSKYRETRDELYQELDSLWRQAQDQLFSCEIQVEMKFSKN